MSDDDESTEVWVRDGQTWFADAGALCKRFGGDYISQIEGGSLFMGISGRGEVALPTLLLEERATDVPPDRSGTVVSINPRKPA